MLRKIYILLFLSFYQLLFSDISSLHLLFTNDIHGALHQLPARFMNPEFGPDLSGGAGAYTYVQSIRDKTAQKGEYVLLTDAGNFFQGTPMGTRDGGTKILKWMEWMGYDAFVPGVRDFDKGVDNLNRLSTKSTFPFLGANIKGLKNIDPYIIKKYGKTNIAIIGLVSPSLFEKKKKKNIEGIIIEDPIASLKKTISIVKKEGADIVILLSHFGLPYNREDEYEKMIARNKTLNNYKVTNALELAHQDLGIDIIITGGIAKGYDKPWQDPLTHTLVLQNYGNLTGIGHLIIHIDDKTKSIVDYSFPTDRGMMITLLEDDIWPDFTIADSISKWVDQSKKDNKKEYDKKINMLKNSPSLTCSTNDEKIFKNEPYKILGTNNKLDIMTWNMERFPLKGDNTLEEVIKIIQAIDVDIIGVQEILKVGKFSEMMSELPGYDFIISEQSSFMDQAIIFKKDVIQVISQEEPFSYDDYYFAGRPPMVADFLYKCDDINLEIIIVNMHLKCCGDGLYRRQKSMKQLHTYLNSRIESGFNNIIVLGDWNDEIQDEGIYQSFTPFLEDIHQFRFATELIVEDSSQQSYPTWPSFLDHIMISKGFFNAFEKQGEIRSVNIDDWMGGWSKYENTISDHRPILISLPFNLD